MDSAEAKAPETGWINFLAWLELNRTRVLVVTLAVVAVVVGLLWYVRHESEREDRASRALSEVRTSMNPAQAAAPESIEGFRKIANEYQGTQAGARALLMAGSNLFLEGKYDAAQAEFERFLREYPGSPWAGQAALGVAKAFDARNQRTEAITKYDDVRKRFANTPVADEATLGLARMYELEGKQEEAIKLYHALSEAASSSIGTRAGYHKEILLKTSPELTNAIAPILPVAAPTAIPPVPQMTIVTNAPAAGQTNIPGTSPSNAITVPLPGAAPAIQPVPPAQPTPAPATPTQPTPANPPSSTTPPPNNAPNAPAPAPGSNPTPNSGEPKPANPAPGPGTPAPESPKT